MGEMRKLILFGDSNTYGYDPREFATGRYPAEARWATIVSEALSESYQVIEDGMNGRQLPDVQYGYFTNMLSELSEEDTVVMMLGTNDILLTYMPDAKKAAVKMERILGYVKDNFKGRFIMIAPPFIEADDEDMMRYRDASIEMNRMFLELAGTYNVETIDAAAWNIPMAYDGVHFTMDGQKRFGECFISAFNMLGKELK